MSKTAENLSEWMAKLSEPIKQIPIINLAIPGMFYSKNYFDLVLFSKILYFEIFCLYKWALLTTEIQLLSQILTEIWIFFLGSHDSMSYGIGQSLAEVAPDAEPVVRPLYKVMPCVIRRWAVTQKLNALEQLNHGIR